VLAARGASRFGVGSILDNQPKIASVPMVTSGVAKAAIVVSLALVALNAIATFAECGPIECPSDPTSYWLFK